MLSVKQLGKRYGDKVAIENINFDIGAGEIVALLGANGSGKTTTINSICRLIEYEMGEIYFDEQDISTATKYLSNVGAVLGGCRNINWRLTAKQNAAYFARLHGATKSSFTPVINHLHAELGLDKYEKMPVMKLSTGNKQKAGLLSALSYSPKLLLLDEPTLGLDFDTVDKLQTIITNQAKHQSQAFLVTSHDLSFIDKICNRVIVINEGKQIFDGDINSLKNEMFHFQMCAQFSLSQVPNLENAINGLVKDDSVLNWNGNQMVLNYKVAADAFPVIGYLEKSGISPDTLTIEELSIEGAYRSLLAQHNKSTVDLKD